MDSCQDRDAVDCVMIALAQDQPWVCVAIVALIVTAVIAYFYFDAK